MDGILGHWFGDQ